MVVGGCGDQAQHCQSDQEPIGGRSDTAAECDVEGLALRFGQFVDVYEQRCTELLQSGECELDIGLHARNMNTAEGSRLYCHVLEQRGLADAGLPAEHQHSTAT